MSVDPSKVKVVAFDLFGTVFDMSAVPKEEVRAYIDHIEKPEWSPLVLPEVWQGLPLHRDSPDGLRALRRRFRVVTCSNAPLGFLRRLSDRNRLEWSAIVPLEANQVFKPDPRAYLTVCQVMGVEPSEVLMVTANQTLGRRDYGDVQAASGVGMQSILIRHEGGPKDILELADMLGVPR